MPEQIKTLAGFEMYRVRVFEDIMNAYALEVYWMHSALRKLLEKHGVKVYESFATQAAQEHIDLDKDMS